MAYLWRIVLSLVLTGQVGKGVVLPGWHASFVSFMILPDQLRYPFTFSEQLKFSKTTTVLDSQMSTLSMYVHVHWLLLNRAYVIYLIYSSVP